MVREARRGWGRVGAGVFAACLWVTAGPAAALNITTQRYGPERTAANLEEAVLGTAAVRGTGFGKQGSYAVDGIVFAHPLYLQGLAIAGGTYNVLFVATMHNVVYAFDADRPGSAPLWKRDLRSATSTFVASQWVAQTGGELGVMSTPVIDATTGEMFFTAYAAEGNSKVYRLYSVNVKTGADTKPPVIVAPTQGGRQLDHPRNFQRAGLALSGSNIWIAFGGNSLDTRPYTGWVLSYDKTSLQQTGQFRTSTFDGSTIWQGGGAPAVDAAGNVYLITANGWGTGATSYDGVSNFAQSLLKMGPTASTLIDHFTPAKQPVFDALDQDFSTNTPVLLPGTGLVTAGSKVSDIYVARTANLGRKTADNSQLVQTWRVGTAVVGDGSFNEGSRIVGTVYWNRSGAAPLYYVWPGRDQLRMYSFDGQKFSAQAVVTGSVTGAGEPGIAMSLSANGGAPGSGVLWASRTTTGASAMNLPSVLEAYDAENPATRLWSSADNAARDGVGSAAKFVIPTVANGRVYLPTQNGTVLVYGLLPDIGVSAAAGTLQTAAGDTASTTLELRAVNGFSGNVALQAAGLPAGVSASFAPALVASSGSSVLRLSVAAGVAAGSYPVTVQAIGGGLNRALNLVLKVTAAAAGDFTLSAATSAVTAYPGGSGTATLSVGSVGGFGGSVALAAAVPTGVTAGFAPGVVNGSGNAVLTLAVGAGVPVGTQQAVVVTATSGALLHRSVVTLNIGAVTPPTTPTPAAPAAPSGLSAVAAAPNSTGAGVTLRWTDNSANETGFVIQRSTVNSFASDVSTLTVSANATLVVDTAAPPSTLVYYRMRATNAGANSAFSNTATVLTSGQLLDSELNDLRVPTKIMAIGDSVTHGSAAANAVRPLWTALRDAGCAANAVGPYNWADTAGDTDHAAIDGLRATTAAATYAANWAQQAQPDVVLLHLGTYDAIANAPAASTVVALGSVIDQIRTVRPDAAFFVARLIGTGTAAYNLRINEINALLPAFVAAKAGEGSPVTLVDQAGALGTADLQDGIRPNAAGMAKMAARWFDALVASGRCKPAATPMSRLSLGRPVTTSANTTGRAPGLLVNGTLSVADEWVGNTASAQPQTIEVDLGASRSIGAFALSHYTGYSLASVYNARDFRIAVRAASADDWRDVVAVAGNTAGHTLHPIAPVTARYVRLTLMRPNAFVANTNYSTLREFEVYGW